LWHRGLMNFGPMKKQNWRLHQDSRYWKKFEKPSRLHR
jgi:hypothetical protein